MPYLWKTLPIGQTCLKEHFFKKSTVGITGTYTEIYVNALNAKENASCLSYVPLI